MEDPRIISTQFNSPKMPYYNVLVNILRWYYAYEKPIQQKWRIARYHQLPRRDFRPLSCL